MLKASERLFADIAIEENFITPEQVDECVHLRDTVDPAKDLAQVFVELRYIDRMQSEVVAELVKKRSTLSDDHPTVTDIKAGLRAADFADSEATQPFLSADIERAGIRGGRKQADPDEVDDETEIRRGVGALVSSAMASDATPVKDHTETVFEIDDLKTRMEVESGVHKATGRWMNVRTDTDPGLRTQAPARRPDPAEELEPEFEEEGADGEGLLVLVGKEFDSKLPKPDAGKKAPPKQPQPPPKEQARAAVAPAAAEKPRVPSARAEAQPDPALRTGFDLLNKGESDPRKEGARAVNEVELPTILPLGKAAEKSNRIVERAAIDAAINAVKSKTRELRTAVRQTADSVLAPETPAPRGRAAAPGTAAVGVQQHIYTPVSQPVVMESRSDAVMAALALLFLVAAGGLTWLLWAMDRPGFIAFRDLNGVERVEIDRREVRTQAGERHQLPPGEHEIRLIRTGEPDEVDFVVIENGRTTMWPPQARGSAMPAAAFTGPTTFDPRMGELLRDAQSRIASLESRFHSANLDGLDRLREDLIRELRTELDARISKTDGTLEKVWVEELVKGKIAELKATLAANPGTRPDPATEARVRELMTRVESLQDQINRLPAAGTEPSASPRTAFLTLNSVPEGALVSVKGASIGLTLVTPVTSFPVPAGRYTLTFKRAGYVDRETTPEALVAGQERKVLETLESSWPGLVVRSLPGNARVTVIGEFGSTEGRAGDTEIRDTAGHWGGLVEVEVSLADHITERRYLRPSKGAGTGSLVLDVALRPKTGLLSIESNVRDCAVTISRQDGATLTPVANATTPVNLLPLPVGRYEIYAAAPGYRSDAQMAEVRENETYLVRVKLQPR